MDGSVHLRTRASNLQIDAPDVEIPAATRKGSRMQEKRKAGSGHGFILMVSWLPAFLKNRSLYPDPMSRGDGAGGVSQY